MFFFSYSFFFWLNYILLLGEAQCYTLHCFTVRNRFTMPIMSEWV